MHKNVTSKSSTKTYNNSTQLQYLQSISRYCTPLTDECINLLINLIVIEERHLSVGSHVLSDSDKDGLGHNVNLDMDVTRRGII